MLFLFLVSLLFLVDDALIGFDLESLAPTVGLLVKSFFSPLQYLSAGKFSTSTFSGFHEILPDRL